MFNELRIKSQLQELRQRWVKAKIKNDTKMMGLWEKMGNKLKDQLAVKQMEENDSYKFAEKLFNGEN